MKRERSTNFNKGEVRLLKELVAKHRTIIDNKKTDAVTNREKEAAWNKIGTLFNAVTSSTARSTKSLKLKYESIRKETKKAMEKHRQELYKTGDGPSSGQEENVMAICSNITGLDAHDDSDSLSDQDDSSLQVPQENINYETEIDVFDAQEPVQVQNNEAKKTPKENFWSSCNSEALKSKISPGLKPVNQKVSEKRVTAKLDQLTNARLELVALQKEIATKEHLLAKYEHKLKVRNLQNDEKRKQEIHEILVRQLNNGMHYETNILDINTNKN